MARLQRQLIVVPAGSPSDRQSLVIDAAEGIGGNQDEDMLCGACVAFLALGVRPETFFKRWNAGRILIKCPVCGARNEVPRRVSR